MRRFAPGAVPAVSVEQMRELDRVMIEDLHIDLIQMMENAGRSIADLVIELFSPSSVTVLSGARGNGGGGLVAARHLSNRGVIVTIVLSRPGRTMVGVPAHQLDILERMGMSPTPEPPPADVVIDALIGYSLRGDPRGREAELIRWANGQRRPIVALDVPSGLDASDGITRNPCIRATATLTLALPKTGLLQARDVVGRLYVADISVPTRAYAAIGMAAPALFSRDSIIEVAW